MIYSLAEDNAGGAGGGEVIYKTLPTLEHPFDKDGHLPILPKPKLIVIPGGGSGSGWLIRPMTIKGSVYCVARQNHE